MNTPRPHFLRFAQALALGSTLGLGVACSGSSAVDPDAAQEAGVCSCCPGTVSEGGGACIESGPDGGQYVARASDGGCFQPSGSSGQFCAIGPLSPPDFAA